ncbi:hypothetical protein WME79_01030 [Sorangium sp. So ce726]|uniref:hypothetical protein n=1 Tax=Sorangium sp. So ce726 TaxID=3133319 RepID=UPI003F5E8011
MARERGDLGRSITAGGTARTFAPLRRGDDAAIAALALDPMEIAGPPARQDAGVARAGRAKLSAVLTMPV